MTTDPDVGDMKDTLKGIYRNIFVEFVVKNPLHKMNEPIRCELFIENFQKEIKGHPAFKTVARVTSTH
jgi:hypothetical protein